MSILFYVLTFLACIVTAAGGAWAMRWHIERSRDVSEREDPRDSQIRDLLAQVSMMKNDMARNQKSAEEATEHVDMAHDRIHDLTGRMIKLANVVASTESELKESNADKDLLRDKLSVASQQLDTLKTRTQELEVELSVTRDADMLEPATADIEHGDEDEDIEKLASVSTPDIDETTPSLLHSLTAELDRWKRHCRVLGDELKLQRERLAQIGETTDTDENPFDSIDELTDIRGIGNAIARKLHQLGIYRYRELAALTSDDQERAQMLIPDFERRMKRDRWQYQARDLHFDKYQESIQISSTEPGEAVQ
jgi:predicted flap endonuclease-1-like 5' DNA nuclease